MDVIADIASRCRDRYPENCWGFPPASLSIEGCGRRIFAEMLAISSTIRNDTARAESGSRISRAYFQDAIRQPRENPRED